MPGQQQVLTMPMPFPLLPFPLKHILTEDTMRKYLGAVSALALLASSGLAIAEEVTGTLMEIDEAAQTFTLEDGTTYTIAEGVVLEGLEPGQEVTVSYEVEGDQNVANSVQAAME